MHSSGLATYFCSCSTPKVSATSFRASCRCHILGVIFRARFPTCLRQEASESTSRECDTHRSFFPISCQSLFFDTSCPGKVGTCQYAPHGIIVSSLSAGVIERRPMPPFLCSNSVSCWSGGYAPRLRLWWGAWTNFL